MKAVISVIVIALLTGAIVIGINWYKDQDVTITVIEKERIVDRDGSGSRYLIWSEDETFENTDELLKGKFNSSDIYGQLTVGKTYQCKVIGWRSAFLSWYRNIISCKEVE